LLALRAEEYRMSKAIMEQQEDRQRPAGRQGTGGVAPSVVQEDDLGLPRIFGAIGAMLAIFGGMVVWINAGRQIHRISTAWGIFILAVGLASLMIHAAFERDLQFRRVYLVFAYAALFFGVVLCAFTAANNYRFFSGYLCLSLGLIFLLAVHRNETDAFVRTIVQYTLGGAGLLMALIGLFGGNISVAFLLPYGLLLSVLGLIYLAAFVSCRGVGDDLAYRIGQGMGVAGLIVLLVALGRWIIPLVSHALHWTRMAPGNFLMPQGLLLMTLGCCYLLAAVELCSDHPLAVLTRRELGAFFFTPMAYLVLLGFGFCSWFNYAFGFVPMLAETQQQRGILIEPIVSYYTLSWITVFGMIGAVTVITMRLLSEENRTGTMEVMMTAPVGETAVVLSKFLAAFVLYMLLWLPFGLYLLAIPLAGGGPFDYRPLIGFYLVLAITGAGFISMGLFFSSLTRNQIISAVLTFVCLVGLTFVHRLADLESTNKEGMRALAEHLSYIVLWSLALGGHMAPKLLTFYLSMSGLFLFLTVKVVEARKWR
jgi:ABC-2 type transport system permease protein